MSYTLFFIFFIYFSGVFWGQGHAILLCSSPFQSLTSLIWRHHGDARHSPPPLYQGPGGLCRVWGFCHQHLLWWASPAAALVQEDRLSERSGGTNGCEPAEGSRNGFCSPGATPCAKRAQQPLLGTICVGIVPWCCSLPLPPPGSGPQLQHNTRHHGGMWWTHIVSMSFTICSWEKAAALNLLRQIWFFFPETWHLFKGFSLWLCPTVYTVPALHCFVFFGLNCGLPHPHKQVHPPQPAMCVRPKTNQHNIPGLTAHTIVGRALCALWWARQTITQCGEEDERTAARTEKLKENSSSYKDYTRGEKENRIEGRNSESHGTLYVEENQEKTTQYSPS